MDAATDGRRDSTVIDLGLTDSDSDSDINIQLGSTKRDAGKHKARSEHRHLHIWPPLDAESGPSCHGFIDQSIGIENGAALGAPSSFFSFCYFLAKRDWGDACTIGFRIDNNLSGAKRKEGGYAR
jgi:hypothetical protein